MGRSRGEEKKWGMLDKQCKVLWIIAHYKDFDFILREMETHKGFRRGGGGMCDLIWITF